MPITLPPVSAGQQILQSQFARDDGATVQATLGPIEFLEPDGRIVAADTETNPSSAVIPVTGFDGGDYGTDDETRYLTDTQATDNTVGLGSDPTDGPDYNDDGLGYPSYSTNAGVGAGNDDAARPMNATQNRIDQLFSQERIVPKQNVLDNYASYTWNAAVYMLKKDDVNKLFVNKRKVIPGSQVLFRSGGVGQRDNSGIVNAAGTGINGLDLDPSNPFTLDCYIDELQLSSKITGRGTTAAHNVFEFKMTVTEPMGMSLLDNLYTCAQNINGTPGVRANYQSTQYLLVIKFYGYDAQGNLVQAGTVDPDGSGEPGVVVEKYYPFVIENITMRLAGKVVQYDWKCKCIPHLIAIGQARGSIPYNIELAGGTLQQLLGSNTNSEVTDPDNATSQYENDGTASNGDTTSAPTSASTSTAQNQTTITSGLMAAMNRYQQKLVKDGIYTIADEYSIEFSDSIIASARLRKPGDGLDKAQTPMDSSNNADKILPEKQSMLASIRTTAAVAGTQIVQFLDQTIRNSTYITDQALFNYDEETQKMLPKAGTAAKSVAWFKIGVEVLAKAYDPKRNDFAYKIKFIVSPYKVDNLESVYFPRPVFAGVHKQYSYWFTGENTQVIDFQQDFNALYYEVISGRVSTQSITSSGRELAKRFYQPTSGQSDQGASGKTNEVAANAADYLYSPVDQAEAKVQIIGDPAWLQQGEAFAGFRPKQFNFNAFLPDGTINYDAQQILFEIDFNLPVDYNIVTGLQDPGQNNYNANRAGGIAGRARQSYIYYAYEVTSYFKQGKFTQELKGKLRKTLIPKIEEAPVWDVNPYDPELDQQTDTVDTVDTDASARSADIGETGQDITSTPYAVPDVGVDPGTDIDIRDQAGISATEASFNLTSQEPEFLIAPADQPSPPTSDGVVVGLSDGPPSPAAAGATGVVDSTDGVLTQNEIVTPRALPASGTTVVPVDLSQYELEYDAARQNSQTALENWQEAVKASNSVNFPGATGSNPDPTARTNWITARQTAANLKIVYNQAALAEDNAYSKLTSARNVSTTEGQQLIARETRGG